MTAASYPDQGSRKEANNTKILFWLALLAGAGAALLGAIVIVGWYSQQPSLIQILPQFVPMQYNAAMGFLGCGLGLIATARGYRLVTYLLSALVLMIGGLTLIQYIAAVDFGIDQLLMEHYITVETSHPGRMAPNTALCFTLTAIGLIFALDITRSFIVGVMSALVVGLGFIAFSGYLMELETAYGWGNLTRMALHTSIGFIILGIGLTMMALREAGEIRKLWWPVAAAITVVTFTLSLAQAINAQENEIFELLGNKGVHYDVVILIFGTGLSVTIYMTLRLMQSAKKRNIELLGLNEKLEKLSVTDHLTKLFNRLKIDEVVQDELNRSRRYDHMLSVILLDIDHFKKINDSFGHQTGDRVLVKVAETLSQRVRDVDIIGRWGGEEFLVVCPETGLDGALSLAEVLRTGIESQSFHEAGKVTCSFGVAALEAEDSYYSFVKRADEALYQAKEAGRNRVVG